MTAVDRESSKDPEADHGSDVNHSRARVRIQTISCGRCGWPNACRVQDGMRALRFMCQWCDQMTTGIVDPSLKNNVIF
jgi:transcription elongation factor Elf1